MNRTAVKLRATLASAIALISLGIAHAQTPTLVSPEAKEAVLTRVDNILSKGAYVPGLDFSKWADFVKQERKKIEDAKDEDEFALAINEAFAKFGASHIYLGTPRAASIRMTGSTVGIGISSQVVREGLVIVRTIPGASAAEAGIVPGDTVIEVDGKKVSGIAGIPGPEGTTVNIKIKHADGKVQSYTLVRKKFSTVRKEVLEEVNPTTAKLSVYTFDINGYDPRNVEKLMLEAQKYPNLILDLRDNGGGAVTNMQHLLGMLLPQEKPIGTFINRRMVESYIEDSDTKNLNPVMIADWSQNKDDWSDSQIKPNANSRVPVYKGKIAVLVNRLSGSAAEIASAALQEIAHAKVVGTQSAGAVLVSLIVPASGGFTLQYPIMDYVTTNGLRLEGNGVTPDIVAEDPRVRLPNAKDVSLEKALTVINSPKKSSS